MERVGVPLGWAVDVERPVERFCKELEAVGGRAWPTPAAEGGVVLARIVSATTPGTILMTEETEVPVAAVREAVETVGADLLGWPSCGIPGAALAELSITGAIAGIAETGSILVSARPPGGRAPSLLAPIHVAFLTASTIRPTLAALYSDLDALRDGASALVLCTGPSKSSDIGKELIVGVHGPGETHVIVIEDR